MIDKEKLKNILLNIWHQEDVSRALYNFIYKDLDKFVKENFQEDFYYKLEPKYSKNGHLLCPWFGVLGCQWTKETFKKVNNKKEVDEE